MPAKLKPNLALCLASTVNCMNKGISDWIAHLKGANCCTLETEICLEVLCNFSHQPLEWQFPDQQFCGLLVPPNFSEGNSTGSVSVGLLYSSCGWSTFTGCLCGQLFTRSLSSCWLTGGLLCTSHYTFLKDNEKNLYKFPSCAIHTNYKHVHACPQNMNTLQNIGQSKNTYSKRAIQSTSKPELVCIIYAYLLVVWTPMPITNRYLPLKVYCSITTIFGAISEQ